MGRFLTEDLAEGNLTDPPSLHRYTYGKVNPTVYVDPSGLIAVTAAEQAALGQTLQDLRPEIDRLQAQFDEKAKSAKSVNELQPLGQRLHDLRQAYDEAKRRFDEGEVFFRKVANWLVEHQGAPSVEALTAFVQSEENVTMPRGLAVATSILGKGACESALCRFYKPFEGMGEYAEIIDRLTALGVSVVLPEMLAVEFAGGAALAGGYAGELGRVQRAAALARRKQARISESLGAKVVPNGGVTARARTNKSLNTAIRADLGEKDAYHAVLQRGEIGLQAPGGANVPGPDFITAVKHPVTGQYEIVITSVKTRSGGRFPSPPSPTAVPSSWLAEAKEAVASGRLDLGDPALEAQIRSAVAEGRVRIRQVNVDTSASGQGAINGF